MVTEVDASDEHDAEEVIREKIVFYKTECIHHSYACKKDPFEIPDIFKRMFGL